MQFNPVKFNHSIMEFNNILMCQRTEYPRIFKKSHWGDGSYWNPDDDDIIENRNIFVPDFHIKQYKSNMPRELTDLLRIKHTKYKIRNI